MIGTAILAALLLAILHEAVLIRRAVAGRWTEIDLSGIEETDEERRLAILMRAL